MGAAFTFIIETLLSLALFVVMARLLLQWTRADFRNPLCQAVVRITNPLVLPLRRMLPPIGKLDTASVVAVLLVATLDVACIFALHGIGVPGPLAWIRVVLTEIARTVLTTLCEPVLRPIRRLIPTVAGLDLSPMWAIIAIYAILILIRAV